MSTSVNFHRVKKTKVAKHTSLTFGYQHSHNKYSFENPYATIKWSANEEIKEDYTDTLYKNKLLKQSIGRSFYFGISQLSGISLTATIPEI